MKIFGKLFGLVLSIVATTALAAPPLTPVQVVDLFHSSLKEGFTDKALEQLDPGVLIFETGFAEGGRQRYALGRVKEDAAFAAGSRYQIRQREQWQQGDMAGVYTRGEIHGDFGANKVALDQTETMLLKKNARGWQIVHIHWSAHPLEPVKLPAPK